MIAHDDGRRRRPSRRDTPLVDAVEAVRAVHRLVIDLMADSLTLRCETSGVPMLVDIDRRPLEQALLNLIFHAHDRRPGGQGRIWLEVARIGAGARATPGPSPQEPPDGCYARLRVTGEGPELSEHDRAGLVAPCAGGQVPGLAVACAIVREAGGQVTVEQRPDGTSISVFLPIVRPPAHAPGTRQA